MKLKNKFIALLLVASLQSCIGAGENSEVEVVEVSQAISKGDVQPKKNSNVKIFPSLAGSDLHGKQRLLPKSFDAKLNLVAVAFERKQQADVDSWTETFADLSKENNQVKFFEVPLISQRNVLRRTMINNGMRSGVRDEKARARTITVYTDREKFFAVTNTKENQITVFVVDAAGKILWRADGFATQKSIGDLRKFVAKQLTK